MRWRKLALGNLDRMDRMESLTRRTALARGYWFARGLLDTALLAGMRYQIEAIIRQRGWFDSLRGFAYDSQEFLDLQREVQVLPDLDRKSVV